MPDFNLNANIDQPVALIPSEEPLDASIGFNVVADRVSDNQSFCFVVYALCTLQILVFVLLRKRRISTTAVALTYSNLVSGLEFWRIFTAAISHTSYLHTFLDVFGIWLVRNCEYLLGSRLFFIYCIVFIILTQFGQLMMDHLILTRGVVQVIDAPCLGSSAMVTAWISYSLASPHLLLKQYPGGPILPAVVAGILVLISSRIRYGYLQPAIGTVLGIWTVTGLLAFFEHPYWFWTFSAWIILLILVSIRISTTLPVPLIDAVNWVSYEDSHVLIRSYDYSESEPHDNLLHTRSL